MEEIKDRIQEALFKRDMTASELAKRSGLNKGAISKYINGLIVPKQSAIGSMAQALGVSPAWLLGYDVPMQNTSIEFERLNAENQARLMAYYQALLDTQEGKT